MASSVRDFPSSIATVAGEREGLQIERGEREERSEASAAGKEGAAAKKSRG